MNRAVETARVGRDIAFDDYVCVRLIWLCHFAPPAKAVRQIGSSSMKRRIVVTLLLLFAIGAVLIIAADADVRIDEQCEPVGLIWRGKAAVVEYNFWIGQAKAIDNEVAWSAALKESTASLKRDLEPIFEENRRYIEKLRRDLNLPGESDGDRLRAEADRIDHARLDAFVQKIAERRLAWMSNCREQIRRVWNY